MSEITLLDGSIGQELVKRSGEKPTPLWSTMVMLDDTKLLSAVHDEYFSVGATVATTNTYPVLKDRLERVGLEERFGIRPLIQLLAQKKEMVMGRLLAQLDLCTQVIDLI